MTHELSWIDPFITFIVGVHTRCVVGHNLLLVPLLWMCGCHQAFDLSAAACRAMCSSKNVCTK